MTLMRAALLLNVVLLLNSAVATASEPRFAEEFDGASQNWSLADTLGWIVVDGVLRSNAPTELPTLAAAKPQAEEVVEARFRPGPQGRPNVGIAVRAVGDSYLLVRYFDTPQTLEALQFNGPKFTELGRHSAALPLMPGQWHRMKVATVGGYLLAKMWPEAEPEPAWQLKLRLQKPPLGRFGVLAHDGASVDFDWVRAWSDDDSLADAHAAVEQIKQQHQANVVDRLKLAVTASEFAETRQGRPMRILHVVPHIAADRHPLAGRLTINVDGAEQVRDVTDEDYEQGELTVAIPEPTSQCPVKVNLESEGTNWSAELPLAPTARRSHRDYVQQCLDSILKHGRDQYGPIKTPLFMAVLDADLLASPQHPLVFDSMVRLEDRLHRRGERGTNPWYDQGLMRSMRRMSQLTNDPRYSTAADDATRYFFDHCQKVNNASKPYLNGMPAWGTHVYWDCYQERPAGDGDGDGPHEVLVFDADWDNMHRIHPRGVQRAIDGIWQYHIVDKKTGLHNRHDDSHQGCDFAFSGGSFLKAMAFMYHVTDDPQYLEQAKIIAGWHWNHRDPKTGLAPDSPGLTDRYDGHHCFTTVVGPHSTSLLEAYRLTKDPYFRDAAIGYIKAYDKYGWDDQRQTYWAMLRLDGTPVPEQPKGSGYDAFAPYGVVDAWRTTIYSYEFTLSAGQAAIQAYETTVADGAPDAELLAIARRWGQVIENSLPTNSGRRWKKELEQALPQASEVTGCYAEDYGRAISLFIHLYRATDEPRYLELAEQLADEATAKLFRNGMFTGHPAKPYYESVDGVGLLLFALLELDAPKEPIGAAL